MAREPGTQLSLHEPETAPSSEKIKGHIHTGWTSLYFSEGRDSLDGDSFWVNTTELEWKYFLGGILYGKSPGQNYDELQLMLGAGESFGNLDLNMGYTHLYFPFASLHDNELAVRIAYNELPLELSVSADAYYSFENKGTFLEVALSRELKISDEFILEGAAALGINQNYVSDGHDGFNHFVLRIGAEYALSKNWAITGHTSYSWAIDKNSALAGDEQLFDNFHVSIALRFEFGD